MRRRLPRIYAMLTLLLLVPAVVVAVCSAAGYHTLYGPVPTSRITSPQWYVRVGWRHVEIGRYVPQIVFPTASSWGGITYAEFSLMTGTGKAMATIGSWQAMFIPSWMTLLPAAGPPLAWLFARRRASRRRSLGLCPRCGYDLRASPERCPECGAVATAEAKG